MAKSEEKSEEKVGGKRRAEPVPPRPEPSQVRQVEVPVITATRIDPKIELARLLEEQNNSQLASARLVEALSIDPNNPRALTALGRMVTRALRPPPDGPEVAHEDR